MATSQANSITILLGLEGYKVGDIRGGEGKVVVEIAAKGAGKCPYCGTGRPYRHGRFDGRNLRWFPPVGVTTPNKTVADAQKNCPFYSPKLA